MNNLTEAQRRAILLGWVRGNVTEMQACAWLGLNRMALRLYRAQVVEEGKRLWRACLKEAKGGASERNTRTANE